MVLSFLKLDQHGRTGTGFKRREKLRRPGWKRLALTSLLTPSSRLRIVHALRDAVQEREWRAPRPAMRASAGSASLTLRTWAHRILKHKIVDIIRRASRGNDDSLPPAVSRGVLRAVRPNRALVRRAVHLSHPDTPSSKPFFACSRMPRPGCR